MTAPAFSVLPNSIADGLGAINLASLLVLGGLIAAASRLPVPVVIVLAAFFGVSHGAENGLDLGAALSVPSALGVIFAGAIAATPAAAIATKLQVEWQRIVVRAPAAGSPLSV